MGKCSAIYTVYKYILLSLSLLLSFLLLIIMIIILLYIMDEPSPGFYGFHGQCQKI